MITGIILVMMFIAICKVSKILARKIENKINHKIVERHFRNKRQRYIDSFLPRQVPKYKNIRQIGMGIQKTTKGRDIRFFSLTHMNDMVE